MNTLPLTPRQIKEAEQQSLHKPYWFRVFRGADKFLNGLTGGNEDETISDRVWRVTQAHPNYKGWNPLIHISRDLNIILNDIQPQHGAKAAAGSLADAEIVEKDESKALGVKPQ